VDFVQTGRLKCGHFVVPIPRTTVGLCHVTTFRSDCQRWSP
jgi:hypothetical protein